MKQVRLPRRFPPGIDSVLAVRHRKQVAGRRRLRCAQHEKPGWLERVVEQRDDVLLHASQVDQHVAATDQVQLRKRRIVDQVVPGEDAHLAQVLVDLVAAFDLREIAVEAFMGKVRRDVLEVPAAAGLFDGRQR